MIVSFLMNVHISIVTEKGFRPVNFYPIFLEEC